MFWFIRTFQCSRPDVGWSHKMIKINNGCKNVRQTYHEAKKLSETHRTQSSKHDLSEATKGYKNIIKRSVTRYKPDFRQTIRVMRLKPPKEYWNYINSLKRKEPSSDIPIIMFD